MLEYITEEGDVVLDFEDEDQAEIHSWLSEVDGTLLSHVINFQHVVLITKSKWTKVIKEANTKEDKKHLSKSIFRLIGKLQSYENAPLFVRKVVYKRSYVWKLELCSVSFLLYLRKLPKVD